MRISKIHFNDHYILGTFELDFTKPDGSIHDTVIFAGENGNGKTTVLDTIASISGGVFPDGCRIDCQLDLDDANLILDFDRNSGNSSYEGKTPQEVLDEIGILTISPGTNNSTLNITSNGIVRQIYGRHQQSGEHALEEYVKRIMVRYKKNDKEPSFAEVASTTKMTVDENETQQRKPENTAYANDLNAAQLLIDINSQDANEVQKIVLNTGGAVPADCEKRIARFRNAFDNFFDNGLTFEGVFDFDILFKKGSERIHLANLSSGEKTIVQYGAFLLKDKNSRDCFIALLDEPEQSLHPRWEERILQYYRSILIDGCTTPPSQLAQLFVTTHSEYVIKCAYENQDKIIILERNEEEEVIPRTLEDISLVSSSPTYNEIKYEAFGLATHELHDELYSFIQELKSTGSVAKTDLFLIGISGCPQKAWRSVSKGKLDGKNDTKSLPSFVRNYSHHPEAAKTNSSTLTVEELNQSIKFLTQVIRDLTVTPAPQDASTTN